MAAHPSSRHKFQKIRSPSNYVECPLGSRGCGCSRQAPVRHVVRQHKVTHLGVVAIPCSSQLLPFRFCRVFSARKSALRDSFPSLQPPTKLTTNMAPAATKPPAPVNCKLLLIGNSSVGKSSLLLRFSDEQWLPEDESSATIGVDFRVWGHHLEA